MASGGIATGSALVPNSAVAASNSTSENDLESWNSGFSEEVTVRDGRVTMTGVSALSSESEPKYSAQEFVQDINKGVKKGFWKPVERGGDIWLKLTKSGSQYFEDAISRTETSQTSRIALSSSSCGVTKRTDDELYLNNKDTSEVVYSLRTVGTTMAVAGVIVGAVGGISVGPVGVIPGAILSIAGLLVNLGASYVSSKNLGCGVEVHNAKTVKSQ
ncbi:hypothetical protein Natpe_0759 [Natrinema pellirubrum DSM 15624]|uniref:Uncharacterized protein n=1 Tax=Natrinema pellirubrum (strain DSM 15624 / CIP 106293 / JCM 10476 / NCIMB 786 / 157) TaxID=797303 RepID=L0JGL9_NATP1|nr:hypothetical protein [Natrinema pellirubrum]AGB30680.1 hypothetical protein Natpe_0759 [Natrinema pellirubrum DSM 15624]